jgi:microcystin degradation protein MlrC
MKIAVGMMKQESASFSQLPTGRRAFEAVVWRSGAAVLQNAPGGSEIRGLLDVCADRDDIELVGTHAGATYSSGPVEREVYEELREGILAGVREAMPLQGVFVALHGSMVAEGCDDPEGELLERLRSTVGPDVPVVATLDLHANVTARMATHASALVGYHQNPHTDQRETGQRAARLLMRAADGAARPTLAWRKLPTIAPGNSQTTILPGDYQDLYAICREQEGQPKVLACSNFAVHPFIDVAELGWAQVVVTDDDPALADEICDALADRAWAMRGTGDEPSALSISNEELLRSVREERAGPLVIGDIGDSVGAGAAGDSPELLRTLLEGGCADLPIYFAMTDPPAVERLYKCAPGDEVTLPVGASISTKFYTPLELTGRLIGKYDGQVPIEPGVPGGAVISRGRTAVLGVGELRVVLSELPSAQANGQIFASVDLDPRAARAIVVKSMFHHVAGFGDIAGHFVWVNTPGPVHADVRSLPYTKISRPVFPLDDVTDWR